MRLARSTTPWGRDGIAPDLAEVLDTDMDATAHFDRQRGLYRCLIQTRAPYLRAEASGPTAIEAYRTALRNITDEIGVAA
jgi:hypothetical protein